MADSFNDKDYSEYFKKIESRINTQANEVKLTNTSEIRNKSKQKNRIYKVVRLRLSVLFVTALIILCVIFGFIKVIGLLKSKADSAPQSAVSGMVEEKKNDIPLKTAYNLTDETQQIPETNDAKNAIIVDLKTNNIIAERSIHQRAFPASTTKIMTLLTAVENIDDFDDTFTMTLAITDPLFKQEASVVGFLDGEVISMNDLLYGLILPSGADAAMGLAIKIAGSEEEFVKLMNQKAKSLGLTDTHFTNVTGLYNDKHYSSVYDMAIILDAAMRNEVCKKVLSTYQYTTACTSQHPVGILLSSTLFSYMYGTEPETATIKGGKTGFVNESGYCIASFGENNTTLNQYIMVTFGNSGRWPAFYGQIDLYKQFAK